MILSNHENHDNNYKIILIYQNKYFILLLIKKNHIIILFYNHYLCINSCKLLIKIQASYFFCDTKTLCSNKLFILLSCFRLFFLFIFFNRVDNIFSTSQSSHIIHNFFNPKNTLIFVNAQPKLLSNLCQQIMPLSILNFILS